MVFFCPQALGDFICDAHVTLVHCNAGVSRAPALAAAHLLRTGAARTAGEALEQVRLARPAARPNRGFVEQLEEYAEKLSREKSAGK